MIYGLSQIEEVAQKIINDCFRSKIWLFYGEMGSGKTTLIRAICRLLKVTSNFSSPTYSIVNEYQTQSNDTIYHFDLYRLENYEDLLEIGVDHYLNSGKLCLIEWPEKYNFESYPNIKISLSYVSELKREIEVN